MKEASNIHVLHDSGKRALVRRTCTICGAVDEIGLNKPVKSTASGVFGNAASNLAVMWKTRYCDKCAALQYEKNCRRSHKRIMNGVLLTITPNTPLATTAMRNFVT